MKLTKRQHKNFWDKVSKTKDGCWEWQGSLSRGGYGRFNLSKNGANNVCLTHRIVASIYLGLENPRKNNVGAGGKIVRHKCHNRKCCNPDHLAIGSQKENMQDAFKLGTRFKGMLAGERNGRAKLNWDVVGILRKYQGEYKSTDAARLLGVNKTQIYSVLSGKSWISA